MTSVAISLDSLQDTDERLQTVALYEEFFFGILINVQIMSFLAVCQSQKMCFQKRSR